MPRGVCPFCRRVSKLLPGISTQPWPPVPTSMVSLGIYGLTFLCRHRRPGTAAGGLLASPAYPPPRDCRSRPVSSYCGPASRRKALLDATVYTCDKGLQLLYVVVDRRRRLSKTNSPFNWSRFYAVCPMHRKQSHISPAYHLHITCPQRPVPVGRLLLPTQYGITKWLTYLRDSRLPTCPSRRIRRRIAGLSGSSSGG